MTPEPDLPAILASLIILALLAGSTVLWVRHLRRSCDAERKEQGAPAWPIGWVNFGILVCAVVAAVFITQNIGAYLLFGGAPPPEGGREMTPRIAIVAILLLQVPMLLVILGARRLFPAHFSGSFNSRQLELREALAAAVPDFVRYLPVIWLGGFVWSAILNILRALGVVGEVPPQQLILLFTKGGDPVAIFVLVLFAIVAAPIIEELVFRGCVYRFFKSQMTLSAAQVFSGALFAVMHGNLLSFLPLVIVGVLLARVYEASGNLLTAICFHGLFNGFSLLLLFIMSHSNLPTG